MPFLLFEAPRDEMSALLDRSGVCDLCASEVDSGFDLESSSIFGAPEGARFGCEACLKAGRFAFRHITEAGYLDEDGLVWLGDEVPESPARVFVALPGGPASEVATAPPSKRRPEPSREEIDLLRATPRFSTWNEVEWPLHCERFMVYLGSLTRSKLGRLAEAHGQSAGGFFRAIVHPDRRHDFDLVSDGEDIVLHGFRCPACGEHRGGFDFS